MPAMLMPLLLGSAMSYAKTRKDEEAAAADAERRKQEMSVFTNLMGGGAPAAGPTPAGPMPGGGSPSGSVTAGASNPPPAQVGGANVMGDVLARHPYMLAQAKAISNITDPDERARAWSQFYKDNAALLKGAADEQNEATEIEAWANNLANMDASKISDPYHRGRVEQTQELLQAGADPAMLRAKMPDAIKKSFEQAGGALDREDEQEHAVELEKQKAINAQAKEQFKNDLQRTTFNYERTATAHDEMNKKLPAVLQTYRELQTALRDIGVGELGTGLIERWQEIPRASKENLQRLSIILGRKALKEDWGESRPTDKDADMAISIQPNPRLSEEQNQRLIMAALYNYDYMLDYHRERGQYLDQFEAKTPDTFYFKGTPPSEEVPGFETPTETGEDDVMGIRATL